jgi:hypothetical protein
MCRRAVEGLAPSLGAVLPLDIELCRDGVRWEGHLILDLDIDRSSIVQNLYRDGVRRIEIRRETTPDEIERFLEVLSTPFDANDLSEDYVTRLWEADLKHIGIRALDPYLDLEFAEGVLEGKERPTEEQEDIGPHPPEADVAPPVADAFAISEDADENMKRLVDAVPADPRWREFVAALFHAFESPVGERRLDELVVVIESTVLSLIREHRFDLAAEIMPWMRDRAAVFARATLGEAFPRMGQAERLAPLHAAVEAAPVDPSPIQALIVAMGADGAAAVCAFLRRATKPQVRRFYVDVLAKLGRDIAPLVLTEFSNAGEEIRPSFARVLGLLREERAVQALVRCVASPNVLVRREVVRALGMIGGRESLDSLLPVALSDSDGSCRIVALRALSRGEIRLEQRNLLERIQSRDFASMHTEEKDLLFDVVAATGNDEAVPILERMLKGGWIVGRPEPADQRRAARTLRGLGSPLAKSVLLHLRNSRRRSLAAICAETLEGEGS